MLRVRTALTGWDGGPGLMTQYFLTPLQDEAAALRVSGAVRANIATALVNFWPDGVVAQTSGDVDVLDAGTGLITDTLSVATPLPVAAAGGVVHAPPSVALLLQIRTATFLAGRRLRGRMFLSPLKQGAIDSLGDATTESQLGLAAFGDNLLSSLEAGDTWVVWSRPKPGTPGSAGPVTAVSVPRKLAVLTSRRD